MNDSRKQASGFKLQSLARMAGVKDENNVSFLNHVEKVIRTAFPGLESFLEDLKPCREASSGKSPFCHLTCSPSPFSQWIVSILDLERECTEFIESVKNVQRSCEIGALSDPDIIHPEDRAVTLILPFLNEAQKKTKNLQAVYEATIRTEFDGVLRYFGEDPSDKSARSGFFRRFTDFMSLYLAAKKENLLKDEARRREEGRKKVLQGGSGKASPTRDAKKVEANNKIMDDLLDKLRASPKDSTRHQRRRAARRKVSGPTKPSPIRIVSGSNGFDVASVGDSGEISPSPTMENLSLPTLAVTAPETGEESEELDLGKVAQGLLAGLKGGDDLLASFREARKSVNKGINQEGENSPEPAEKSPASAKDNTEE